MRIDYDENPANAPKFKIVNINSNRKRMLKKAIKLQGFHNDVTAYITNNVLFIATKLL